MEKINSFWFRHRLISALQDIDVRGVRWLAYHLPDLLLPKPAGEMVIRTLHGFPLKIHPLQDVGVETSIYKTGTYEKGTLQIIKKNLKQGDIFVDVGANIGLMSVFASHIVQATGMVYAFEPHPETRQILQKNIEINRVDNIFVSAYAAGSRNTKAHINDSIDHNRGSASILPAGQKSKGYEVEVTTLDKYFGDQQISMMKVDVEGHELEVLKGAQNILKRDHPPLLIVECSQLRENTFGSSATPLFDYIKSAGNFRIFKARKGKERVSPLIQVLQPADMPLHDNVYCFV